MEWKVGGVNLRRLDSGEGAVLRKVDAVKSTGKDMVEELARDMCRVELKTPAKRWGSE